LLFFVQFDGLQLVVSKILSFFIPLFNYFLLVLSSFLVNHLHLLFLILHFLSLSSHGFFGYTQLPIHKFSIFFIFIIIACFLGIDLVSKEVS